MDHPVPRLGKSEASKRTRLGILEAAAAVFAEKGYGDAHVNDIVAKAGTTKPMIYYHFGSKEGLFSAVLEDVYAGMRMVESSVEVERLCPADGMRQLVEVTFDYHARHPDWIRLIAVANIHNAQHIAGSATIASRNAAVVQILQGLLDRGADASVFRAGVDALHLHLLIASMCFYRVSNRHTWKVIFKRDLTTDGEAKLQREMLVEAVLQFLKPSGVILASALHGRRGKEPG